MTSEGIATIAISDDSSDSNHGSTSSMSSSVPEVTKPRNTAVKKGAPSSKSNKNKIGLLEGTRFLEDFNPETSRREKKKQYNFTKPKPAPKKSNTLYDEQGKIRATKEDVCDCFDLDCSGCHYPCETCNSQKCGVKCRVNRRWAFETIEFDGGNNQSKTNPMVQTIINRN